MLRNLINNVDWAERLRGKIVDHALLHLVKQNIVEDKQALLLLSSYSEGELGSKHKLGVRLVLDTDGHQVRVVDFSLNVFALLGHADVDNLVLGGLLKELFDNVYRKRCLPCVALTLEKNGVAFSHRFKEVDSNVAADELVCVKVPG